MLNPHIKQVAATINMVINPLGYTNFSDKFLCKKIGMEIVNKSIFRVNVTHGLLVNKFEYIPKQPQFSIPFSKTP
jgi:hypothetical protein